MDILELVGSETPIRQGDIFRLFVDSNELSSGVVNSWGLILTADCDIAQQKVHDYFSYLTIIRTESYVSEIWAPRELEKIASLTGRKLCDMIFSAQKHKYPECARLSLTDLNCWFDEESSDRIADRLELRERTRDDFVQTAELYGFCRSTGPEHRMPLERLKVVWKRRSVSEKKQLERLESAVRDMRQEYFFLPTLDDPPQNGFVVLLRDIRPICTSSLFRAGINLRLSGETPLPCGQRIIRLAPQFKFAIAQRFASLFSRIGLPRMYNHALDEMAKRYSSEQCSELEQDDEENQDA
jgi:hypothetical protein